MELGTLLAVTFPAVSAGMSLPGDFCWPQHVSWPGSDVGLAVPLRIPLLPLQGPLEIGPGCLLTGLTVGSSSALQGRPLHDVVLQGHHVRLRELPCRVFTLTGRLDDWQVGGAARRHRALQSWGVTAPHVSPQSPAEEATYLNIPWAEFFQRTGIRWVPTCLNGTGDTAPLGYPYHPRPQSLQSEPRWPPFPSCIPRSLGWC